MNKPVGHVPATQRYSVRMPSDATTMQVVYLGVQSQSGNAAACFDRLQEIHALFNVEFRPCHFDCAKYTDPEGFLTLLTVAYWQQTKSYTAWCNSIPVDTWWQDQSKNTGDFGYFREAMEVPEEYAETIIFKEYLRGLSACPMRSIDPIEETAYWGASRDRIPASAYDRLEAEYGDKLKLNLNRNASETRVSIIPPKNFVVIRSGVSWKDCGDEQLDSFEKNIRPKLDAGMEFLRTNPIETGCCCLRQVEVTSVDGDATKEAYSLGYFLSLDHLENWSREHPTHLAIFNKALAERKKYGDQLELRTYHEVFVLATQGNKFDYINCHPRTGLLPFFDGERGG